MSNENLGPNQHLIGCRGSRQQLATPSLVLDLDSFERNIATMAARARELGVKLRPHAKAHKSAAIGRRQIDAGAEGLSCATLGEAEVLVRGGISRVLITSPVVGRSAMMRTR